MVKTQLHFPKSSPEGSFYMLAVFRRYTFRLDEETVSHALHSAIGGSPTCFHVHFESDRHNRFSVASKAVGLRVLGLRRVTTKHFDVFFHLWRDGGSDWQREHRAWEQEEENQWTLVTRKKAKKAAKHVSFSSPLKQPSPKAKHQPSVATAFLRLGSFLCSLPPRSPSSPLSSAQLVKVSHGAWFQNSKQQSQPQSGTQQETEVEGRDRPHIPCQKDSWSEGKSAARAQEARGFHWP